MFRNLFHKLRQDYPIHHTNLSVVSIQKEITKAFIRLVDTHFIHQHQVQFYADILEIPSQQLYYIIKKHWGKSPVEVIQSKRLNEAKILMQYTNLASQRLLISLISRNWHILVAFSKTKQVCHLRSIFPDKVSKITEIDNNQNTYFM